MVSSSTTDSSTIYLKKSELPKNVSAFNNDAGYISSDELNEWLNNHSYIPKSDIEELIQQGKIDVIDIVNKSSNVSEDDINSIIGEISDIKERLAKDESDHSNFSTKDDIKTVQDSITTIENNSKYYLTSKSLDGYAKLTDIPSLDDYATQSWVEDKHYLTSIPDDYAKKDDIPSLDGYAKLTDVPSLDGYVKFSDLSDYFKNDDSEVLDFATKTWVEEQNYLTSIPDDYAKKDDIPSLDGYVKFDDLKDDSSEELDVATKTWVENQNYLTSIPDEYVKKSELPDFSNFINDDSEIVLPVNLSELNNDMNFATQDWVKEQNYLTSIPDDYAKKEDIPSLDEYAKSDDIPSLDGYAKKEDIPSLDGYAKKEDIPSLDGYAKIDDIPSLDGYAKSDDIPSLDGYAKSDDIPSLKGYATESWVGKQNYLTSKSLVNYVKISDLPSLDSYAKSDDIPSLKGYATESWVEGKNYITKTALNGYATESWVEGKKYLTEHQSLANYAKTSWVRNQNYLTSQSLNGYATESWVTGKNYITKSTLSGYVTEDWVKDKNYVTSSKLSSSLSNYAKNSAVNNINKTLTTFLTKTDAASIYATQLDLKENYLTIKDAKNEYLTIEDYRGIKDATTINTKYQNSTLEDLNKDLKSLLNGFYIVDNSNIAIVKNHKVLSVVSDGIPTVLWENIQDKPIEITKDEDDRTTIKSSGSLKFTTDSDQSIYVTKGNGDDLVYIDLEDEIIRLKSNVSVDGSLSVGGKDVATTDDIKEKQDTLVSGTNIKTINGESILGEGNLTLDTGKIDDVQVNGKSVVTDKVANIEFDIPTNISQLNNDMNYISLEQLKDILKLYALKTDIPSHDWIEEESSESEVEGDDSETPTPSDSSEVEDSDSE